MDTIQLEIFSSIARTMNFSRSAEQFYITQPAVSHHIKMLENSLGVKLISRSSHGVTLTAEGREFLPYVKQILEISAVAENRIQNMAQGRWGHIRIAALSSTTNQLSDCLVQLYKQYPSIQVDVDLLEGSEMIGALQKGDYDFYLSVEHMVTDTKDLDYTVIYRDHLKLFVNKDVADTIDLEDWSTVERQPFVSVPQSDARLSNQVRLICKNRGIKPHIINYYNRAESVVLSVNVGIGIAILPGELGRLYQRQNVVTLPIEGNDADLVSVFAWKTGETTTACSIFKEIVLSIFSADADNKGD
ncbi:DNA-binding transcriptional regulator, LysR family [Sporobacter termitidis DSM 10068]|uniref:DNA-binding transcriptional regulator, LysR family n=1 Tax=Sporobacter termitidis DSM 10068 TaxID=1123282 RepID=A0A1M5XVN9_9FIRM|nr:LysR family transcriptional regulator [Sporobacter termitidis]SHI03897.1 DNA-binding transcriptional regulator, LysR family [Sporobacter termitidis DSM 10068]